MGVWPYLRPITKMYAEASPTIWREDSITLTPGLAESFSIATSVSPWPLIAWIRAARCSFRSVKVLEIMTPWYWRGAGFLSVDIRAATIQHITRKSHLLFESDVQIGALLGCLGGRFTSSRRRPFPNTPYSTELDPAFLPVPR